MLPYAYIFPISFSLLVFNVFIIDILMKIILILFFLF